MKTIITGVQTGISESLEAAMRACPFASEITEVLSNQSRGIARWGEEWAQINNIPVTLFSTVAPAPQKRTRKTMPQRESAYKRDQEMVKAADALVLVWDGKYKRNAHMLLHAQERGLRIWSWNMFKRVGIYMEGVQVIPINDVQKIELADHNYLDGYRAALLFTFRSVLDELGYDSLEEKRAAWILEREEAIAILRKVCAVYGDNDWPDDLSLGDVITRHLEKYLP